MSTPENTEAADVEGVVTDEAVTDETLVDETDDPGVEAQAEAAEDEAAAVEGGEAAVEADEAASEATDEVAGEADAPAEPEETDPVEELRKQLRRAPGEWYVIHSYAGYENKVKANLETRVQNLDVGDYIFQ
ncbi:MAG TPA: transcription termination/antitermination factor NusG, partial [Gordonia polyisoprenivorans]|nr:transcription termination/antitermination factor NusG [Gordonia polyisoprenivorans]